MPTLHSFRARGRRQHVDRYNNPPDRARPVPGKASSRRRRDAASANSQMSEGALSPSFETTLSRFYKSFKPLQTIPPNQAKGLARSFELELPVGRLFARSPFTNTQTSCPPQQTHTSSASPPSLRHPTTPPHRVTSGLAPGAVVCKRSPLNLRFEPRRALSTPTTKTADPRRSPRSLPGITLTPADRPFRDDIVRLRIGFTHFVAHLIEQEKVRGGRGRKAFVVRCLIDGIGWGVGVREADSQTAAQPVISTRAHARRCEDITNFLYRL